MSWTSLPQSHIPLIILAWTSIIVHFLIIIVIRKFRKRNQLYQNPYITLALAQSIPSIMLLLHVELFVRPREYGLFQVFRASSNSKLAAILLGLQTTQKSQLIIFQIPFAINRFTAFVTPTLYRKIWSFPTIALSIALPLAVPVAFVAIPVQYNVSFVANGDGINLQTPSECMAILSIAAQSCSVLTIIICVPLYAVAAYHSRKTYAYAHNPHIVKQERIHLICALVSFGVIILDSIRAALLIISTFQHPIDFALYEAVMPLLVPHYRAYVLCATVGDACGERVYSKKSSLSPIQHQPDSSQSRSSLGQIHFTNSSYSNSPHTRAQFCLFLICLSHFPVIVRISDQLRNTSK